MGSCRSTKTIAGSPRRGHKTITNGQSSDIKEPEHYSTFKREDIETCNAAKTDVVIEGSMPSTLTSSQLTYKTDKTNRYEIGLQILKAKINHGADPKTLYTHGDRTSLMFAVMADDIDFVKKLVKLGVDVNKTNSKGETALGFANELNRYDIASFLRKHGAVEE